MCIVHANTLTSIFIYIFKKSYDLLGKQQDTALLLFHRNFRRKRLIQSEVASAEIPHETIHEPL